MDITLEILSTVHLLGLQKSLPVTGEAIRKSLEEKEIAMLPYYIENLVKERLLYKEDFENIGPGAVTYLYQLTKAGEAKLKEKQLPLLIKEHS